MESIISPIIGDIVINDLIYTCLNKIEFEIPFVYNFVDDLILCIPKDKIISILDTFNSYDENLKFTIETENQNCINYLDTTLINENDKIIIDWYQKPISSGRYILYNSNHPFKQKLNLIFGLKNRIVKISENKFINKNLDILYHILKTNGYPNSLLKRILFSAISPNITPNLTNNNLKTYQTLPYIPKLSQKLSNILKYENIIISFKNVKTVGNLYTKLKDKVDKFSKFNVVYSIKCKSCHKQYIGQTSQNLKCRITQHISNIKCKPNSCALSKHAIENLHQIDFNDTKILACQNNLDKRLFLEMVYINKIPNNINFKKDIQNLSNIYSFLLKVNQNIS